MRKTCGKDGGKADLWFFSHHRDCRIGKTQNRLKKKKWNADILLVNNRDRGPEHSHHQGSEERVPFANSGVFWAVYAAREPTKWREEKTPTL